MAFASNKPLYLLHMDLCGSMHVHSINGKRYVLVVVDDYSRYTWVFFLHSKDEASEVIISFIKKTQVNLQLQVQRVRTDNGAEFKNKTLAKFFDEIMKSLTTNVETSIIEEVFHEVSESFQGESSSSSLNDDVQQSPEEVILPQTNTQSIPINMIPNGDEASTSHNDNKNVNEILTAKLERYKKQKRSLKEQNNVDKALLSYEQSLEIEKLKHTLSKNLKEKESLEQKVTLLTNDFQKEESRNIDRELALEKQVANLSTYPSKRFNSFYYDDDDEDYAIAVTPSLSTEEPDNSLSMMDEHLDTILAMESDEFIKSSVEDLVPIPSESKGESECDVPAREEFTTFSNILFDAEYEFDSCDDQSFYDEDIPKKIFSNPLFEEDIIPMKIDQHHYNTESDLIESLCTHDSSIIISSKIDSLFDEFAGELTLPKSILPGIDETDCYPEEETHSDTKIESFSPSHIQVEDSDSLMEEIDLSFSPDYPMPPGIKDDEYDSERDILILKNFPSNDNLSFPAIESFYFDIPSLSRPLAKPPDGNTEILNVKMMGDIFDQKVPIPRPMITLASYQEKSPDILSHRSLRAF
nr:ribonuclease H-like domain-containing protein [Tanacetum cinerariifolium]